MLWSVLYYVTQKNIFKKIGKYTILLLMIVYATTGIADAGLYREWNAKINMQALSHFANFREVLSTVPLTLQITFIILTLVYVLPVYTIYTRYIQQWLQPQNQTLKKRLTWGVPYFLVMSFITVLFIRGGLFNIPINQGVAYFSKDAFANDIAVNPLYNVLQDATIQSAIPKEAVYKLYPNNEAKKIIATDFTVIKDTTIQILRTQRPNLLFIILESWSADNIEVLGGLKGCTPAFNALAKEGLLFTRAYSNAYVSDQGIPAILSAEPCVSRVAVINQPKLLPRIHAINEVLKKEGYYSAFMFGGELVYGNLIGYLFDKNFDEIIDVNQLSNFPKGKLGIHEEYLLPHLLGKLNYRKQPFLQAFFTTSTHMPYDLPTPRTDWHPEPQAPEEAYTAAVHYSDYHIGKFIEAAKKQPWYNQTLIVLVADHSHNSYRMRDGMDPARYQIPILFTGGALLDAWKGKTWDKIVSQLDITSTILHQMQLPDSSFPWSRNMLNPYTPSSAFYTMYGGIGYVCQQGYAGSYQHNHQDIKHAPETDSLQYQLFNKKATAMQQIIYESIKDAY